MSIGQKFKNMWNKLRRKNGKKTQKRDWSDAELSAEAVIEEEVFPKGKRTPKSRSAANANAKLTKKSSGRTLRNRPDNNGKVDRICKRIAEGAREIPQSDTTPIRGKGEVKPTHRAGRSRPTNDNYEMIDPTNGSADASKS